MANPKKKAVISGECTACGCCVKACPLNAISIYKGMYAVADEKCVGCGECVKACSAAVISISEVSGYEEEVLV